MRLEHDKAMPEATETLPASTLTLTEAAAILGIPIRTAYRLVQQGDFPVPTLRVGGRTKVSRAQMDAYLAPRPT